MRQIAKRSLVTAVAAGGMLAAVSGYAYAESGADAAVSGSPGVASGNSIQVPVHAPVNVCGNTVNVIAALNPSFGETCANNPGGQPSQPSQPPQEPGGSHAPEVPGEQEPEQPQEPGPGEEEPSGQTPGDSGVHMPPVSHSGPRTNDEGGAKGQQAPAAHEVASEPTAELAETGSSLGLTIPLSAGALLGGAILYRKSRRLARD
ncbi:hypothetical protein AQ490_14005 [Wenjunlia vitaminophila]|uniref:Chaplin domain-containing protein n=1 Tax=Wenjunlia vitaminophila TaxID=76728 RepID=A0A0T6LVZ3_WENVI|nr:chaplin [Wenjunlia vitaminophila]KRV50228.1 hypothetical protein AQ490_14005 [Wenjunlia vitaminophila]